MKLASHSFTYRWLISNPPPPLIVLKGQRISQTYQRESPRGVTTAGHTHSPVITSRPQSLPSHILESRRGSRRISCGFRQRHAAQIKGITHHPAAEHMTEQLHAHTHIHPGVGLCLFVICLATSSYLWEKKSHIM